MLKHTLPLLAACLVFLQPAAFASGSSVIRIPVPGAGAAGGGFDREKFGLGQKIFSGGVKPAGHESAAAQGARLRALQAKLPESVAQKRDLNLLAGRLLPEQLDALEYFVTQRYPAK